MECVTDILRDLLLKQKALLSQWLADLNNKKKTCLETRNVALTRSFEWLYYYRSVVNILVHW